ncbi:MAG: cobalt-precorrin-7 (C5)-methyltransferase [Eubacteriaceae bacterium]|jgi:cobalt-precorrin-7 (C5)-methyltransferase|nr:cobalt-precorrin-7 (C5)-methyltransferase [Eubacteriaceae bacterium]MDK2905499.1 cobalt-precorrin-7 (C5)-methyltransferase [Eubacteriaceae bacterium]MDK2937025.1 cobalt-precorrin-7 (C5)-methyltransferase [Eubacteriaceae bacterium]MDN5307568.1 cobalt-precorrin-7 (C5)-methyltransferase [Eubacteriaceae bacterium]
MYQLKIIGLGPGNPDYILPIARKEIEAAQVILCGRRHTESFNAEGKEILYIGEGKPLTELMDQVVSVYQDKQTALVVSGDTGFYSLLTYAKKRIPQENIVSIPGISSMQYLFAKLNRSWEHARLASLHGRSFDLAQALKSNAVLGLLTDKEQNTAFIAKKLDELGYDQCLLYVGQDLSYETEKITRLTVAEAQSFKEEGLAVVVIINE